MNRRRLLGGALVVVVLGGLAAVPGFARIVSGELIQSPLAERPDDCANERQVVDFLAEYLLTDALVR